MKFKKTYGETIEVTDKQTGKSKWIKLGITIESEKEINNEEIAEKFSKKLMRLGRKLIKEDINEIKQEENDG